MVFILTSAIPTYPLILREGQGHLQEKIILLYIVVLVLESHSSFLVALLNGHRGHLPEPVPSLIALPVMVAHTGFLVHSSAPA